MNLRRLLTALTVSALLLGSGSAWAADTPPRGEAREVRSSTLGFEISGHFFRLLTWLGLGDESTTPPIEPPEPSSGPETDPNG